MKASGDAKRGLTRGQTPRRDVIYCNHLITGGGGGIRTRDTVSRIHTFQACAFSRSATPPTRAARKQRRRGDSTGQGAGASSACSRGQCDAVANTASGLALEGAADEHAERRGHRVFPRDLSSEMALPVPAVLRVLRDAPSSLLRTRTSDEACSKHAKRQAKESAIGAADREPPQAFAVHARLRPNRPMRIAFSSSSTRMRPIAASAATPMSGQSIGRVSYRISSGGR